MSEKEQPKKKGLEKWFSRDNLIILVLAGILLFVIALPTQDSSAQDGKNTDSAGEAGSSESVLTDIVGQGQGTQTEAEQSGTKSFTTYGTELEYAAYLEEQLEEILGGVSGVGEVEVMVTLESSEELIVEKDEPVTNSNVEETDSAGGTRTTVQTERNETTIYSTANGSSEPYVVMKLLPKVEGVLVVAQGAGNGTVNKSISEIVQALFDVEAHKIKVVKMDGSN